MKVITKSVIDIASGETVLEESYSYQGEVALCGGGGGGDSNPGPSQAEQDLQRAQAADIKKNRALLEENARQQDLLAPFFFESAGLEAVRDDSGKIISFNKIADPLQDARNELEGLLLDQQLASAKAVASGELPAGLVNLREEQKATLEDTLRKQLGPDFATSSAGIDALARFDSQTALMAENANLQELASISGIGVGREGFNQSMSMQDLGLFGSSAAFGSGGNFAERFGAVASLANNPLQRMSQERMFQQQLQQQAKQAKQQMIGDIAGAAGSLAGTALGGSLGGSIGGALFKAGAAKAAG